MKTKLLGVVAALIGVASSGSAGASAIELTFEGINATYPSSTFAFVQNFYNGGTSSDGTSGTNFGISFSSNAQALCLNTAGVTCSDFSRGGAGNPASQTGALFFSSGTQTLMNIPGGLSGGGPGGFLQFAYSTMTGGSVTIFSGENGTGTVLATRSLPANVPDPPECLFSLYHANFCPFLFSSASNIIFSGIAESVSFGGIAGQIAFDDIRLSQTPLPSALPLFATGLAGLGLLGWRRKKKAAELNPGCPHAAPDDGQNVTSQENET
jgi:hypothetical protein